MSESEVPALRARLGRAAGRIFPGLEDRAFRRTRDATAPDSRSSAVRPPPFTERAPHVVVVPQEGPGEPSWRPGTRNFYFEAFSSARETWGEGSASVLEVARGEAPARWMPRLIDHIGDTRATHVLTHLEHDPGNPDDWNWDRVWARLARNWDGVFLGVLFDSAFSVVRSKARRLARMSANFVAVDICTDLGSELVRGRAEIGPVTMPLSQASLDLVHARLAEVTLSSDVSFIGAMYPYRVDLVAQLRALGVNVAVNPHRKHTAEDFASSRHDQPGWLDYMAGLAGSRMTLNFSRSSAGDVEQYKTRVIEATVAGTLLLTDDRDSTRQFFLPGREFGSFRDVLELPAVIASWLADPVRLDAVRMAGKERAWALAPVDFWNRVSAGLDRRGLPRL